MQQRLFCSLKCLALICSFMVISLFLAKAGLYKSILTGGEIIACLNVRNFLYGTRLSDAVGSQAKVLTRDFTISFR